MDYMPSPRLFASAKALTFCTQGRLNLAIQSKNRAFVLIDGFAHVLQGWAMLGSALR